MFFLSRPQLIYMYMDIQHIMLSSKEEYGCSMLIPFYARQDFIVCEVSEVYQFLFINPFILQTMV